MQRELHGWRFRHPHGRNSPPGRKRSTAHARIRAIGERANATLKTWKILTRLRCSPHRATPIVQAILVLHKVENPTYRG
jgi:hypothetical protein